MNKRLIHSILGLLYVQFVLGILANLYQEIPKGEAKHTVYMGFGFISLHVLVALGLLGLSLWQAIKAKNHMVESWVGAGCVMVALSCGSMFVETDNDLLSLGMAIAFLGSLVVYSRLAYASAPASDHNKL